MEVAVKELEFLDFKVVSEPWNEYKLSDGSTIRVKVVTQNFIKEKGEDAYSYSTSTVLAVVPNPKYIGVPSPPLKPGERLESYIEAEDLEIVSKTENWNEYEIPSEGISIKIRGFPVIISRTKRHDGKGLPVYLINIQPLVKPKKRRK